MEEIELREALRQHVHADEPPLGLTADALLNKGRRQQRWRIGLSLGSGSAATAIAIVGALTLTPLGGGSSLPTLDDKACTLPLAPHSSYLPVPSPGSPDVPHSPSPGGSASVPPVSPTAHVTNSPYQSASPNPSGSANVPSVGPSETFNPSPSPVTPWPPTPWPVPSGAVPFDAPMAHAATCYLTREIGALFPAAAFLPFDDGPPMSMRVALLSLASQPQEVLYEASATAIEREQATTICFTISRNLAPAGVTSSTEGQLTIVKVNTGKSLIEATVTGSRLTVEQLTRLASAPELDRFR
ncbi:MAG TPA: hypothetical protein DGG94_17515 [Micromonosporaceae bacterium]|nr:hypothetical protein [Micromonosporaceae bacterium]HCU51569.1 hypothetical protein [Micromonosporaceae bacterium]